MTETGLAAVAGTGFAALAVVVQGGIDSKESLQSSILDPYDSTWIVMVVGRACSLRECILLAMLLLYGFPPASTEQKSPCTFLLDNISTPFLPLEFANG